jgi:hypothetical protein
MPKAELAVAAEGTAVVDGDVAVGLLSLCVNAISEVLRRDSDASTVLDADIAKDGKALCIDTARIAECVDGDVAAIADGNRRVAAGSKRGNAVWSAANGSRRDVAAVLDGDRAGNPKRFGTNAKGVDIGAEIEVAAVLDENGTVITKRACPNSRCGSTRFGRAERDVAAVQDSDSDLGRFPYLYRSRRGTRWRPSLCLRSRCCSDRCCKGRDCPDFPAFAERSQHSQAAEGPAATGSAGRVSVFMQTIESSAWT